MSSFRLVGRLFRRHRRRLLARTLIASLLVQLVAAALPPAQVRLPLAVSTAEAETLASPRHVSAAVMPNGQVGLLYANGDNGVNTAAEIRFTAYTGEHALAASMQLSTAGPWYPQLATFRGRLVAGYVDSRAPNDGRLVLRASDDNGLTWSAEAYPFGAETFDRTAYAPRLVPSRDGQTLYLFHAIGGAVPRYRSTTDPTLVTWTAAAVAGDATMRTVNGNNCGNSGSECYRAHAFGFMETATAGRWVYIAKSDAGFGQSGRGTQAGTLGGSWTAQVDHGGSGGLTGCCGESTATTFLGRDGSVYYTRAGSFGEHLYTKRSTDGGSTWGAAVQSYAPNVGNYTTSAPVGLYVSGYTFGEYVWYAGFGGTENTVRVLPLWSAARSYAQTGTVRLFGSAGGDLDPSSGLPYNFGDPERLLGAGGYTTSVVDLTLPGRGLPLSLARTYNSGDLWTGVLGPGWTHSLEWSLVENGDLVTMHRGDGRQDRFTRSGGTYARPVGVTDTLVKNGDGTFTLTSREQLAYDFVSGKLTAVRDLAGDRLRLTYRGDNLVRSPANGAGATYTAISDAGSGYQAAYAANGVRSNSNATGVSWATNGWRPGDWWRVNWSAAQSLSAVRLWDRSDTSEYFGRGRLRFSDGTSVTWSGLPNDAGDGSNYLEVAFPRKTGITWFDVVTDADGLPNAGLAEVEAYDDDSAVPATDSVATSVIDAVGRTLKFTYSAYRLAAIEDPAGQRISYAYDSSGRLASVVDRIGNTAGQDPNLHTWRYAYDGASRHLATITDPDGRIVVTNAYDSLGRLSRQTDGASKTTTLSYAAGQTNVLDPRGNTTAITYDPRNRVVERSNLVGAQTLRELYEYDGCGNTSAVIDRGGNRADYAYDAGCRGNLLTLTAPQLDPQTPRYTTTFEYDGKNNLTRLTDARGFSTTHSYDPTTNVRLSTSRQIDGITAATTKLLYADAANPGLPTRIIAPRGNTTGTPDLAYSQTLAYDTQGNLRETISADGAKTTHSYDALGRRTSTVDPDGNAAGGVPAEHTWTVAYDPNDQLTSETDPLGRSTRYAYDGAGNRASLTDKNGHVTTYLYDGAGRLWKVRQRPDPTGQPTLVYETLVTRDANGNTASLTRANGVVTDYTYDALDRLTGVTSHPRPSTSLTTSYTLDGRGLAISRTAGNGEVVNSTYDAMGRLTQVSATSLATVSYQYDPGSLRTAMIDGTGTTTYSYDGLGRLTQATQPGGATTYSYDLDSNLATLGYPATGAVSYAYSAGGRLSSVTDWAARVSAYTYTARGLPKTVTLPNALGGLVTTYGYDRADRLTTLTNTVGATTITSHAYTLDGEGNRTALDEFVAGITAPGATDTFGLSYDGLHRLTAVSGALAEGFTLDAGSNQASRSGPAATYTYDTSDRLTGDGTQAFGWDGADRLTSRGLDTFSYDPLERMTASTVAATPRTYTYNGDGLLQSRSELLGGTAFLWDPASGPARLLQHGSERIVYGLGPLYTVSALGTTSTFARDALGSIRAEMSGAGLVTASFRYRSYGGVAQSFGALAPTTLGYAGELGDPSGLVYLRARWYDPATGRFLSRDPLRGDPASPATLNAYGYAHANPVRYSDPSGMCAVFCALAIPGAMIVSQAGPGIARALGQVGAAAARATARARQIHALANPRTQNSTTVAVLDGVDDAGRTVRIVASSESNLRRAQQRGLGAEEFVATGNAGVHAEVKAIEAAQRLGVQPQVIGTSRQICGECQTFLAEHGLQILEGIRLLE